MWSETNDKRPRPGAGSSDATFQQKSYRLGQRSVIDALKGMDSYSMLFLDSVFGIWPVKSNLR